LPLPAALPVLGRGVRDRHAAPARARRGAPRSLSRRRARPGRGRRGPAMKIAVVGGGSTYTPELVSGLTRLDVSELVLHDIDPERRDVVGGMAKRMLDRQRYRGSLVVTGELDRALDGADFVLVQIRVGGQRA